MLSGRRTALSCLRLFYSNLFLAIVTKSCLSPRLSIVPNTMTRPVMIAKDKQIAATWMFSLPVFK